MYSTWVLSYAGGKLLRCMDVDERLKIDKRNLREDDDDDFKIKGAASRTQRHGKDAAPAEDCIICLQAITERAIAVPCNHLTFDFICMVSWLQQRDTCPLCNAIITEVQYDWHDSDDYKTYRTNQNHAQKLGLVGDEYSRASRGGYASPVRGRQALPDRQLRSRVRPEQVSSYRVDDALARRRRVYQRQLYSLHVGANSLSRYRNFTAQEFYESTTLQSRARMFLRRELQVFSYFDSDSSVRNREFVLEYTVAILKKFDAKGADGCAEDFLSEFLDRRNSRLLLHELHAWLRSPYSTLETWDSNVQYADNEADMREKSIPIS